MSRRNDLIRTEFPSRMRMSEGPKNTERTRNYRSNDRTSSISPGRDRVSVDITRNNDERLNINQNGDFKYTVYLDAGENKFNFRVINDYDKEDSVTKTITRIQDIAE